MVVFRSAVEAIIEQLGTDQLDTLFLALPLEAVPLIGQYYITYRRSFVMPESSS
jgi:hypothetical protein